MTPTLKRGHNWAKSQSQSLRLELLSFRPDLACSSCFSSQTKPNQTKNPCRKRIISLATLVAFIAACWQSLPRVWLIFCAGYAFVVIEFFGSARSLLLWPFQGVFCLSLLQKSRQTILCKLK